MNLLIHPKIPAKKMTIRQILDKDLTLLWQFMAVFDSLCQILCHDSHDWQNNILIYRGTSGTRPYDEL